jgi:cell division transport system permease protein
VALSAFFALISFIIIFNTIRVAIYTQRIEISIKKLVGATNWFIRGPYLVVALVFSIISTGLSALTVVYAVRAVDPHIGLMFQNQGFLTEYLFSHIILLFGVQFAAVLFLTIVSSLFAMRKHLRV